jgi:hypothetical protein
MPYSVHPHGVLYNRNNEGANYNNMAGVCALTYYGPSM